MKATGIIRRIDDLGRVIIPKEIRRTLRIREGDPLEIFLEKDTVCFKKYSALGTLDEKVLEIAQTMAEKTFHHHIAIYDRDSKISGSNSYDSCVGEDWEVSRVPFEYKEMCVYPILSDGELYGYVCCPQKDMGAEMTMIVRYLCAAVGD